MKVYLLNKYFKQWVIQYYTNFNPYNNNLLNESQNSNLQNSNSHLNNYIKKYKLYNLPKIKQDFRLLIKYKILLKVYWYYLNYLKLPKEIIEKIFNHIIFNFYTTEELKFIKSITEKICKRYQIDYYYEDAIILNLERFILDSNIIQKTYYNVDTNIFIENNINNYGLNLDAKELFYDNKFYIIEKCINFHNFFSQYIGSYDIRDFYFEFFQNYINSENVIDSPESPNSSQNLEDIYNYDIYN